MSKRKTQSTVILTDNEAKLVSDLKEHIASYLQAQLQGWKKIESEQAFEIKDILRALAPKFRLPKEVEFSELELHTIAMFLVAALRQSLDVTDKNLFQWAADVNPGAKPLPSSVDGSTLP